MMMMTTASSSSSSSSPSRLFPKDNKKEKSLYDSSEFSDCDSTVATFESNESASSALSLDSSRLEGGGGGTDHAPPPPLQDETTESKNHQHQHKIGGGCRRRRVRFVDQDANTLHPHMSRHALSQKEKERCYYNSVDFCKMRMDATVVVDDVLHEMAVRRQKEQQQARHKKSSSLQCNAGKSLDYTHLLTEDLRGMEPFTTLGKNQYLHNRRGSHEAMLEAYRQHATAIAKDNNKNKNDKNDNDKKEKVCEQQLEKELARLYGQACAASAREAHQRGQLDAWIVYGTNVMECPDFIHQKNHNKKTRGGGGGVGSKLRKLFGKRQ